MAGKFLSSVLAMVLVFGAALVVYNITKRQRYDSQVVLAKELHKAMDAMMGDLRQARTITVKGVPPDGQWHHAVTFNTTEEGPVQYRLNNLPGNDLARQKSGK